MVWGPMLFALATVVSVVVAVDTRNLVSKCAEIDNSRHCTVHLNLAHSTDDALVVASMVTYASEIVDILRNRKNKHKMNVFDFVVGERSVWTTW